MKKILSFLVLALTLALSCTKEGPVPVYQITDLYTAPADATVMTLSGAQSTWATDRRYFDLNFGTLTTTLVGYDALLAPGQYVLAGVIGGDKIGNAINTKLNGQPVGDGFITVNEKDGQYAITATINGQVYYWTGSLPFTPDADPTRLSEVLSAQSNKQNGVNSLTMQLATPGISQEFDATTWQTVWVGEGGYLALDIYSEDGYLHEGAYVASAEGGVINPGEFGIGYDTTMQWGDQTYEMKDWGTCWWDVKDGAATATKITDGMVNVSSREEKVDGKDVTIWTIAWGAKAPVEVIFEGAIPALTKPKKPDVGPVSFDYTYTIGEPQACILSDNTTVVEGVKKYPFTFKDADGQEVAYLEFVLADGAVDVEPGDYVSTEYAHEVGQLANGYFFDMGDWGTFGGGSYYIKDGAKVYIDPGVTVTVTQLGTGAFKFTSDGFDLSAAGPNYVPGSSVETDHQYKIGEPQACILSDNTTVVEGVKKYPFTITDADGQQVAYLEFVLAEGAADVEPGDYVSTEYAHEIGQLANGYFFDMGDWGTFGGGSYYIKDGAKVYIDPGVTVTVTQLGPGAYTFSSDGFEFSASRVD